MCQILHVLLAGATNGRPSLCYSNLAAVASSMPAGAPGPTTSGLRLRPPDYWAVCNSSQDPTEHPYRVLGVYRMPLVPPGCSARPANAGIPDPERGSSMQQTTQDNSPGWDAGMMRAAADVLRGSMAGVRFEATDDCPWQFAISRSIH